MSDYSQKEQEKKEELKAELVGAISDTFPIDDEEKADELAEEILEESVEIEGPEIDTKVYELTLSETGGQSTKPGNIKFRPKKIIEITSSGALTVGSAVSMPLLAPFAAVLLWASIWRGFSIDLSTETAFVYYVIWEHGERGSLISENELPELVEEQIRQENIELHITEDDINKAISELKRIDSLATKEINGIEHYRGKEWCRKKWK